MVFKLFGGGKPDHPLADDKGVKEVLGALPVADPHACLDELREWINSVAIAEGFKPERRAELVKLLEDTAQPHVRRLARDYLANPRMTKVQETRLWGANAGLWKDLGAAYVACLDQVALDPNSAARMKALLPVVFVRALQAIAAQLKWHYMHYEQADAAIWQNLGRVYRFAEERKLVREAVAATTPEREFAKALVLAASSPDSLVPSDIELAERIVAHYGAAFVLADAPQPQVTRHFIDLGSGQPPQRLAQTPAAAPGLRYFSAGAAATQIDDMIKVAGRGGVPSDLNLGSTYESARVLATLRHLKQYWSPAPPVRQHERFSVRHRITVVNGFANIHAQLNGGANGSAVPESWVTDNISAGGIGAVLTAIKGDWLRVGPLVSVQVEGGSGSSACGVIRRCWRPSKQQTNVGIRTFARESFAVTLEGLASPKAILLNDGRELGEQVQLCLPEGAFEARASPTMHFDGQKYLLIPGELVDAGDDFEIARFRVMRESTVDQTGSLTFKP
jgi:hypothetical protein